MTDAGVTVETHLPARPDSQIADAARAYCSARHANKEASVDNWTTALAEVDRTYYEMMKLCGYFEEPE